MVQYLTQRLHWFIIKWPLLFLSAAGQIAITTPVAGGAVPAVALPQGAQMTRQARRLYVGNIPFGITEASSITFVLCSNHFLPRNQNSILEATLRCKM